MEITKTFKKTAFVLASVLTVSTVISGTTVYAADGDIDLSQLTGASTEASYDWTALTGIDATAADISFDLSGYDTYNWDGTDSTIPTLTVTNYSIPANRGFKSYESYKVFGTSGSTAQSRLQQQAVTNENGFRMVNGRYLVAAGTAFGMSIGQEFDVILENGTVIPCMLGDAKANRHTDSSNIFTLSNGCCTEFIVDPSALNAAVKASGNCSSLCEEWNSPVVTIAVYSYV